MDYGHFPPLDWYEMSRISLFVTYHVRGGGFEALSFDEEADFGGVQFPRRGRYGHPLHFGPSQTGRSELTPDALGDVDRLSP